MKLPNLKPTSVRKPKAAAAKQRSSVRMPRALEDLYRDMRDRRLLVPAVLLIVAIAAVPLALSAPKEEAPAAVAFVAPEGAEAVAPAVLAEQPIGVRDYRERLDELKSKNPFAGGFAFPGEQGPREAANAPTDTPPAPSPSSPSPTTTPTAPSGGTTTPTDTTDPGTTPPGGGGGDTGGSGDAGGEILVIAPRIDVIAGPVGHRKKIENVKIGDLLPDRRDAPVAMFLGADEDFKTAQFLVSADVTETGGEGNCRPRGTDCEFLRLADGETRYFRYEPDGKRYAIKVTDIREKIVDRRKLEDE